MLGKFRSAEAAYAACATCAIPAAVVRGDDDLYWLVTLPRLASLGHRSSEEMHREPTPAS